MSNPKVTVLMPVYNEEKYVGEAVDSILNQTFDDFEFLIVNDGSTDRTLDILKSYTDPRFRIINNRKNIGITKSLNKGLRLAKGEYIARMDADDIAHPERLERQVNFLEDKPKVGVVGTQMQVIDKQKERKRFYSVPLSHNEIVWNLIFGVSFIHPSVMMRMNLLKKYGLYNDKYDSSQDLDLWIKLASETQYANLNQPLLKYRVHHASVTQKNRIHQKNNATIVKQGFISELLAKPVSLQLCKNLISGNSLDNISDKKSVTVYKRFVTEIYENLIKQKYFSSDDLSKVRERYISKINRFNPGSNHESPLIYTRKTITKLGYKLVNNLRASLRQKRSTISNLDRKHHNIDNKPGLSIVIITYNRPQSLASLLSDLTKQELADIPLELVVFNNYPRNNLEIDDPKLSNLFRKFPDLKIINSNHNFLCRARYSAASLSKYSRILFLDDDVVLKDQNFIRYMNRSFEKLNQEDILSCWCGLWKDWTNDFLEVAPLIFLESHVHTLTKSDSAGSGICMFNKQLLGNSLLWEMAHRYPDVIGMGFALISSIKHNSQSYYLPANGLVEFHKQRKLNSISGTTNYRQRRLKLYKELLSRGYKPTLDRIKKTDELKHEVSNLPIKKFHW